VIRVELEHDDGCFHVDGVNGGSQRDPIDPDEARRVVLATTPLRQVPRGRTNSIPATSTHPCSRKKPLPLAGASCVNRGRTEVAGLGRSDHEVGAIRRAAPLPDAFVPQRRIPPPPTGVALRWRESGGATTRPSLPDAIPRAVVLDASICAHQSRGHGVEYCLGWAPFVVRHEPEKRRSKSRLAGKDESYVSLAVEVVLLKVFRLDVAPANGAAADQLHRSCERVGSVHRLNPGRQSD